MGKHHWKSAITHVEPNRILLRGYPIETLMGYRSYAEAVYLAIRGELPGEAEGRMVDAVLVSSVDHGVTPPSILAAITAASSGSPLNAAIAAGVLAISRHHGGAIENCMKFLAGAVAGGGERDEQPEETARRLVKEYRDAGKRISGYGHRLHTEDPRTVRLFELAGELDIAGPHVEMARAVEDALEAGSGKRLPLNVDGAIAAVLLEMGFEPELANAFFIMARLPGMVAHIQEEYTRQRPMRAIDPFDVEYDGPPERMPEGTGPQLHT
jgi:citrate synthase